MRMVRCHLPTRNLVVLQVPFKQLPNGLVVLLVNVFKVVPHRHAASASRKPTRIGLNGKRPRLPYASCVKYFDGFARYSIPKLLREPMVPVPPFSRGILRAGLPRVVGDLIR